MLESLALENINLPVRFPGSQFFYWRTVWRSSGQMKCPSSASEYVGSSWKDVFILGREILCGISIIYTIFLWSEITSLFTPSTQVTFRFFPWRPHSTTGDGDESRESVGAEFVFHSRVHQYQTHYWMRQGWRPHVILDLLDSSNGKATDNLVGVSLWSIICPHAAFLNSILNTCSRIDMEMWGYDRNFNSSWNSVIVGNPMIDLTNTLHIAKSSIIALPFVVKGVLHLIMVVKFHVFL